MKKTKRQNVVTLEKINTAIENLALSTAKGFAHADAIIDQKLSKLEERLTQKINGVKNRIDDLASTVQCGRNLRFF